VVIYGGGLGPSQLIQNQPANGVLGTALGGTAVSFNGIAAPLLYTSEAQVAAIVPYAVTGTTAQVTVAYQGEVSASFTVPVTTSAPSLFTLNQTGAGQAAAINAMDGTANTAVNPVKIGGYISLYATGEGQTTPTGPVLAVRVTVGGMPATVQYAGPAPGQAAGLMQVNIQIPSGVQPGGYVPVVLQVGDASTTPGAVWVAVSGN
jgi:trimeric autotransporter adhesin